MEQAVRQKKESELWNKQAPGYDDQVLRTFKHAYDLSIQKVRSLLSPGQRILEIGCGTGIISLGIASCAGSVVATDISPQMIAVAKSKAAQRSVSNIDFRVCDGYSIQDENESFDVVLLFNLLHIIKEPETVLHEAYRLLKPGGLLVSATDCYAEPVPFQVRLLLTLQKLMKVSGAVPFLRDYRKEDLHQLFKQSSYTILDTEVLHPAPVNYYLLAKKGARPDRGNC